MEDSCLFVMELSLALINVFNKFAVKLNFVVTADKKLMQVFFFFSYDFDFQHFCHQK